MVLERYAARATPSFGHRFRQQARNNDTLEAWRATEHLRQLCLLANHPQ